MRRDVSSALLLSGSDAVLVVLRERSSRRRRGLLVDRALGVVERQDGDDGSVGRSSDGFGGLARDSIDRRHDCGGGCQEKLPELSATKRGQPKLKERRRRQKPGSEEGRGEKLVREVG
jgi:hypothetical protein